MSASDSFELWFNNQSGASGRACVYHSTSNVSFFSGSGLQQLAWLMAGANPSVWLRFVWTVQYGFIWIDHGPVESFQKVAADPATANKVTLSHNSQGFHFGTPQASAPSGSLMVAEDGTVPTGSSAVVGITMGGSPSFGNPTAPNQNLTFTPAAADALSYLITFGAYTFQVGDVITPATLNPSASVSFPTGTSAMTVVLDATNTWKVTSGRPALTAAATYVTCLARTQRIA